MKEKIISTLMIFVLLLAIGVTSAQALPMWCHEKVVEQTQSLPCHQEATSKKSPSAPECCLKAFCVQCLGSYVGAIFLSPMVLTVPKAWVSIHSPYTMYGRAPDALERPPKSES